MANNGFNGSTVTFPSTSTTIGSLRGISYDESATEVDVTASGDSVGTAIAGIPRKTVTIELVGGATVASGSTGALGISWFDGGTVGTLTKAVCLDRSITGSMDGEITSSIKFANTTT